MRHELKCWPSYFDAIWRGDKTFEVRYDDRGFQTGDYVELLEYDAERSRGWGIGGRQTDPGYTGRSIMARIGYVLHAIPVPPAHWPAQAGHNLDGYVVFSLLDVERRASRDTKEHTDE